MLRIGEYESTFRAAAKPRFQLHETQFQRPLFIHDLVDAELSAYRPRLEDYLGTFCESGCELQLLAKADYGRLGELMGRVVAVQPGIVCTYRNLGTEGWRTRYSLGEDLELLCQELTVPVLVLPHPRAGKEASHALKATSRVMVVADHLTGDDRLVDHAAACVSPGGTLIVTHVEAQSTFDYYLGVISRIAEIDSDVAEPKLRERLLKEPLDYIQSVADALARSGADLSVVSEVTLGHRLVEYRRLIEKHTADLLVLNGKDPNHTVMHPMAYPLAAELDEIPLLLL